VERLHANVEAFCDLRQREATPVGIDMLVDAAADFLAAFRGFCRKVRFLGQNPKIGYQKFNDLQIAKLSKKQLCDRTD